MDFLHAGLFSYCHYSEKDRVVGFKFEPLMEAHIRDFAQNFTQYQVKQIRNIKSGHAIRLYELLRKSHPMSANNGQSFLTVDLDELKRILGIDPKHYSRFFDFKKTILIHSQDEMKEKTDLCFDFEAIRVGRKVGKIKFAIKHNRSFKGVVESHDVTPLELTLEDQLKAYFPNNILTLVQNEFDNDRIERNLKYVQEQQAMGSVEINHPGKYLLKAIKDDYAKPPESKSTIDRLLDTSWDIDGD
ncbi:plasmid replication initiation protein [Endozoicomonas sp. NE41]